MAINSRGRTTEPIPYVCPTCSGVTAQFRPVDQTRGNANTVRVDHKPSCERWAAVQNTIPVLIRMRHEAVKVMS